MAEAFIDLQAQDATVELSHAEWLGLLVDREVASRDTRRFQTRMRAAKLRHIGAAIEDVDFRTPRKLDRALFQQLATGRWIKDARNLMITGPCGVGKTWIACALGQSLPRQLHCHLPAVAPSVRRSRTGPWRRTLSTPVPIPRESGLAHTGRLGSGSSDRRSATGPHGNRRGPPRARLDPDHQPLPVTAWHDVIDEPTSPMPSSTAWSTTLTASNSTVIPCGAPPTPPKKLTKAARPDIKNHAHAATILR